jgi:hypothetical protein
VGLAGAWIFAAYFVSREHKRRSEEPEQEIAKEPSPMHPLHFGAGAAPLSAPQSK